MSLDLWQPRFELGGQEHDIYEPDGERVFKITKRSAYGLYAAVDPGTCEVGNRPATPLEYLERLRWHNVLFGDDIALEGVAASPEGAVYTITSQPHIAGRASTHDEIAGLFVELGFDPIDLDLGAWARASDSLALCDALPRNVITDGAGRVLPIDIIFGCLQT